MIHVVIDRLSKMIVLTPTTQGITAAESAKIFRDHIFKQFGLPLTIVSDRGTQFVSNFTKELHKLLDIKGKPSTAYHPQTDGQTERANAGIEQYLRLFCNYRQTDWVEWLAMAEFTHNDHVNRSTGKTPFELNIRRHPRKHPDIRISTKNDAVHNIVERMRIATEDAKKSIQQAQEDMKRYYDQKHRPAIEYTIGDRVWLEATHLTQDRPSKKLSDRRLGPFEITQKHGHAYHLALPATWSRIHPVFNEALLTPYHPPTFPSQTDTRPPPDILTSGEEQYEVERIENVRRRGRGLQFLVKWKGYPIDENTWEPSSSLTNCPDALHDFYDQYPDAPRLS
jgi:hypothetical protein